MLNPLWLRTFVTLVEVGHFTRTAEKLHMTQPGVSQQIRKLEAAVGYPLLRRENRGVELTEQGRMLYDYALEQREEEARLLESLGFDDPHAGVCKLACSGAQALLLYPQLLSLQQRYPGLKIHLEAAPNRKIMDDLDAGRVDLGILTQLPGSLFHSEVLGEEALCLLLPRGRAQEPITAERLLACGLVDHPDALHYLALYCSLCGDPALAGIDLDRIPRTGYINQISQILLPVARGQGFTVLPASALESFPERDKIHIAQTPTPVRETLYLVHKRNRQLPQRYEGIRALLWQVFAH